MRDVDKHHRLLVGTPKRLCPRSKSEQEGKQTSQILKLISEPVVT